MSEPDVSSLISVAHAVEIIDSTPVEARRAILGLLDAQGLRIAQDVFSDRDFPPFDKSQMDGFAVRAADVREVPAELKVIGEIAAGHAPGILVAEGEAA